MDQVFGGPQVPHWNDEEIYIFLLFLLLLLFVIAKVHEVGLSFVLIWTFFKQISSTRGLFVTKKTIKSIQGVTVTLTWTINCSVEDRSQPRQVETCSIAQIGGLSHELVKWWQVKDLHHCVSLRPGQGFAFFHCATEYYNGKWVCFILLYMVWNGSKKKKRAMNNNNCMKHALASVM